MVLTIRVFAENLVGLGFLESVSYIEPIPTHENLFAVGKSGPTATFNLIFLGLRWPWVGEFVGFFIIYIGFPTQQNLVNRKHPPVSTIVINHCVISSEYCSRCTLKTKTTETCVQRVVNAYTCAVIR